MKRNTLAFAALLALMAQTACASYPSATPLPAAPDEIRSDKPRLNIAAPEDDVARLVSGNNAFAFDLYHVLAGEPGNLFFSPHSISSALAMTYAGARGATAEQMAQALHFELAPAQLHPSFNSLDLELAQRGQGAKGKHGEGFQLRNVNALWGQKGYTFLPAFLDVLGQNYGAGLRLVDFGATEQARQTINNWVSDQTEDRINNLIAPGALDAGTRLVLTNAIYFNAAWAEPFNEDLTETGDFNLGDGRIVKVPMMRQTDIFAYAEGDRYQAIELAYDRNELSMIILLPAAGQFAAIEKSLNSQQVASMINPRSSQRVALTMPKFKVEASFLLADALQSLGMRDAFRFGPADFSGMDGTRNLYIGQVVHKAFVDVDEAGTEAAAATAVMMVAGAAMQPQLPVVMKIDRPFIFLIRDNATGAILFVGRVLNPAG